MTCYLGSRILIVGGIGGLMSYVSYLRSEYQFDPHRYDADPEAEFAFFALTVINVLTTAILCIAAVRLICVVREAFKSSSKAVDMSKLKLAMYTSVLTFFFTMVGLIFQVMQPYGTGSVDFWACNGPATVVVLVYMSTIIPSLAKLAFIFPRAIYSSSAGITPDSSSTTSSSSTSSTTGSSTTLESKSTSSTST